MCTICSPTRTTVACHIVAKIKKKYKTKYDTIARNAEILLEIKLVLDRHSGIFMAAIEATIEEAEIFLSSEKI